jgi:hypothetical protein
MDVSPANKSQSMTQWLQIRGGLRWGGVKWTSVELELDVSGNVLVLFRLPRLSGSLLLFPFHTFCAVLWRVSLDRLKPHFHHLC